MVRIAEPYRKKENEGHLSWSVVSKENDEGSRYKDLTQTASGKRISAQADPPKSTRPS